MQIVQSSRSWVSFEDFAVAEDTSVDKLDKIYIRHSSDMSIDNIPGAFREDKVAITSQVRGSCGIFYSIISDIFPVAPICVGCFDC